MIGSNEERIGHCRSRRLYIPKPDGRQRPLAVEGRGLRGMRASKARTGRRAGQTCHRRRNAYGRPQGKGRRRGSPRSSTTSPLNCWRRRSTRWRRTQPPAWIGGRGRTTRQTSNTISRTCSDGSNGERIGHCRPGAFTSPSRTVSSAARGRSLGGQDRPTGGGRAAERDLRGGLPRVLDGFRPVTASMTC